MLTVVTLLSGCSLREVQLWFQVAQHKDITRDQAKALADAVNAKRAGQCDGHYSGSCVPDNATQVHCWGTDGPGPSVDGPLTVAGFDSFELDADGDKNACVDPVGTFDYLGQWLIGVRLTGWTFDPNSGDPIAVDVYDNNAGTRFTADEDRADLAAMYPRAGSKHGFDLAATATPGTARNVCVFGINAGAGGNMLLRCKNIQILAPVEYFGGGVDGELLVEAADRLPDGTVHVRGYTTDSSSGVMLNVVDQATPQLVGPPRRTRRDDVNGAYGITGDNGFEVTFNAAAAKNMTSVCASVFFPPLEGGPTSPVRQCRTVDS